jgi:predicted PurR-regulated permease PerM
VSGLPKIIDLLQEKVVPWLNTRLGLQLQLDVDVLRSWISENWDSTSEMLHNLVTRASTSGAVALNWMLALLLVPVVMFYLLADWPNLLVRIERMVPRPYHARFMRIMREIDVVLGEFLRGQLSVMLILAVFYSVGLWIAGITFWAPVGILTGLLVFIPYVGFGLGMFLAFLVAALQFAGWGPLIGVAIVYSIGQIVESFLLTPFLVGERIGLHPLAAIFALMAFGQLFGFAGVLVALPVCAALLVALRELRDEYFASAFYRGKEDA